MEGLKEKKNVFEHHQTAEHPRKGTQVVGNCLVYFYQFLTSNSNFKTKSLQNFLFS